VITQPTETEWAEAVDKAVIDGACATFFTLPRLLSQIPADIRELVREEMAALAAPTTAAWWIVGYVRLDEAIGLWRPWCRADREDVRWLLIPVSEADYRAAIAHITGVLAAQRAASGSN
jgi:hypothetical protein